MAISSLPKSFFIFILFYTTISITNFDHAYSHCLNNQKTLLLSLKNDLIFDPSLSRKLVHWNQTDDCCSWEGVECDGTGYVISLQLDDEAISGEIENSSALFSLTYLENLNLADNKFNYTQIPRGIHYLTNLTHLNLSDAGFAGQIPVELSLLTRLVSLDISWNQGIEPLEEHLDLTMLLQNLTRLEELYLDGIDISSMIILSSLPVLNTLSLISCNLQGPIDPSLFQLHSLSVLRLDQNNLSMTAPHLFANFSSLITLSLSRCSLEGSFPESIFQVPSLQNLDLSYNKLLSGTIPEFPQGGSMRSIELSFTNFSGSLPDSLSNLSMLSYIGMSFCKFTGRIPTTLANLTELVYVDLSDNFFTGAIPLFHMSKKLAHIDLSFNNLTGSLSSTHFEGLSNVVSVNLGYNSLSGSIPQSLLHLPSLEELWLPSNQFEGTFQLEKIQNLRNLTGLSLSFNRLSVDAGRNDSMGLQKPYHFPSFLSDFDLHSNQLRGELPLPPDHAYYVDYSNNYFDNLINPLNTGNFNSTFSFFSVANNSLSGAIPAFLCNSTYLEVLDLSFNNLSGHIPPCLLENLDDLQVLKLGGNSLSGDIPNKVSVRSGLKALDLSNNNLSGSIPKSLANCKSLQVVNVGHNNINDSFPCKLPSSLRVLVLRSNRFHGEIACQERLPNLQIIDIASNNFSGYLHPIAFSSWRGMMMSRDAERGANLGYNIIRPSFYYLIEVALTIKGLERNVAKISGNLASIDFSSNNFQGEIPDAISDLSSLYLLNMSHNALSGAIPKSFGKLRQLGSLDLSVNQLRGMIPGELTELTFLSVLNLSYNNLVGKIPTGHQFQTFSPDMFEGNAGLCGFPLNTRCSGSDEKDSSHENSEPDEEEEIEWSYVSAAFGYVVGLGSIVWILVCCGSLRLTYFDKVDKILGKIFDHHGRKRRNVRRLSTQQ
ncbi:hypothetical protein ACS0TY_012015 [Phlomoides rotata]